MSNVGDVTGLIALAITLLWWFGITPQRIARWTKERKVWGKIIFIIPILATAFGIFDAAYHFIADPYGLGQNKWSYGGFWIALSFVFATLVVERYIKRGELGYSLLSYMSYGRILFITAAVILFDIGLDISLKDALIVSGVSAVVALLLTTTIFLTVRYRQRKDKANY